MFRIAFIIAALTVAAFAQEPFAKGGVAFLQQHCVKCHGEKKQKADLTLHTFRDDAALLKDRKKWKRILDTVQRGEMPPDDEEKQPTDAERAAFLASAKAVFSNFDKNAKPDPGRVTLRRLNRAEYNNTIRDLTGLDVQPANDFPSDDIGHGFDNIGDVLSVSPVLMERYLDAAQSVAEQAVPLDAPLPNVKRMNARYCEPAGPNVPMRGEWRPFTPGKEPIAAGPLHTPFTPDAQTAWTVRARVWAESPDGKPVKAALLVSGGNIANPTNDFAGTEAGNLPQTKKCRILRVVDVTARDEKHAQIIEAPLPPTAGIERMGVAVVRGEGAQPTLYVQEIFAEEKRDGAASQFLRRWSGATDKPPQQRTRELLANFMPRAWRRPIAPDEIERVAKLADASAQRGGKWEAGIRDAVIAVLASPKFIFRMEPDDAPENPEPHPINEFQLATRLSYFLWATCPDDELLALAQKGQLSTNLDAQLRRMLRDKRAETLTENFAMQWLQLRRLVNHEADEKTFRRWRPSLRSSMLTETRMFFAEIIREDRSILDLLDADFTYADRRLGEIYGLSGFGDGFQRISLKGTQRGGLLTHASVLTVTSNPTRTSPVKRGKWILEQLLGDPPPPPPPNVPSIDDDKRKDISGTFRQRLEQHRADPKCGNCHAKMDTMGFALENFNGIGQWRDKNEQGQPVEVGGKVDGLELTSLGDLKKMLRERKDDFARCLSEKLLIYAIGRGLEYYDERTVDRIAAETAKGGYKFSALIGAIVKSDAFRLRRGKGQ